MAELHVSFYTLQKLEDRNFSLPTNPYNYDRELGRVDPALDKQAKDLGIFFWRDELHGNGVFLLPSIVFPVNCFFQQAYIDDETMSITEWDKEPAPSMPDLYSWVVFNKPVVVVGYDSNGNPLRQD